MSLKDAVRFMVRAGEEPALLARVGATVRAELTKLGNAHGFEFSTAELEQALRAELGELSDEQLAHASGGVANSDVAGADATDPNALVQWVLRESYLETTDDLRDYAEKVKHFNTAKKTIRDYLR